MAKRLDSAGLVIFSTYFNLIVKGKDGNTPAMRLGLAKGAMRF
ncbi:hypothetical protein ACS4RR_000850 [Rhizobium sp. Z1P35]